MIKTRAQSFSEYSLFLAIVLIAIVAMNVYVKRGLQGRYADVADSTISTLRAKAGPNISVPSQYEPYYADSTATINAPTHMSIRHITDRDLTDLPKKGYLRRDLLTDIGPTTVTNTNVEKANVEGATILE